MPKPNRGPLTRGKTGSQSLGVLLGAAVLAAAPVEAAAAVAATGTLVLSQNPTDGQTIVIGATTYTFVDADATGNEILLGGDLAATKVAVLAKLLDDPVVNRASSWSGNNLLLTAKTAGTAGNSIATTDTLSSTDGFANATLTGGAAKVVSTVPKAGQFAFYNGDLFFSPDGANMFKATLTPVS